VIDQAALVAHIKERAAHPNLLIHSVLAGLATAIERGDFDIQEGGDALSHGSKSTTDSPLASL
jgi:hypothetical protein